MKAHKPTATPNFQFISSFVWQRSPESQFFGRKSSQKIIPFHRRFFWFFRQKIYLKIESLHLQQISRPYLGIQLEFFSLAFFASPALLFEDMVIKFLFFKAIQSNRNKTNYNAIVASRPSRLDHFACFNTDRRPSVLRSNLFHILKVKEVTAFIAWEQVDVRRKE